MNEAGETRAGRWRARAAKAPHNPSAHPGSVPSGIQQGRRRSVEPVPVGATNLRLTTGPVISEPIIEFIRWAGFSG